MILRKPLTIFTIFANKREEEIKRKKKEKGI